MITHPITKTKFLSPQMQHSCAIIGAAFLVMCVSAGWLKYLSFQGAVTAGVVGAGLVSVAIENQRRSQVIQAKPSAKIDPLDRYRVAPTSKKYSFEGVTSVRESHIDKDRVVLGTGEVLRLATPQSREPREINIKEHWRVVSMTEHGYVQVCAGQLEECSWDSPGTPIWERSIPQATIFSVTSDEATRSLYVSGEQYSGGSREEVVWKFGGISRESTRNIVEGWPMIVLDENGRAYHVKGTDKGLCVQYLGTTCAQLYGVWGGLKIVKHKIYYLNNHRLSVYDLQTNEHRLLMERGFILRFDIQGDLIVFQELKFERVSQKRLIHVHNLSTEETITVGEVDGEASSHQLRFCGEDTIASVDWGDNTVTATWLTFAPPGKRTHTGRL